MKGLTSFHDVRVSTCLIIFVAACFPASHHCFLAPTARVQGNHGETCPLFAVGGGRFRRIRNLGRRIFRQGSKKEEEMSSNLSPMDEIVTEVDSPLTLKQEADTTTPKVSNVQSFKDQEADNFPFEVVSKLINEDSVEEGIKMTSEMLASEEPTATLEQPNLASQVDSLFAESNPQSAFELLDSNSDKIQENEELYWRYVKCHYELFAAESDKNQQEKYLREGIDFANKGLDGNFSNSGFLLKWKAIMLGKLGSFQPTKEKMQNSFLIRDGLLQAREILPEDGSIDQALGEWCFKVAGISFMERKVASVLFGSPPESTYEEALGYFEEAYKKKPTPTVVSKVVETLEKMNNKSEAKEWQAKAESM